MCRPGYWCRTCSSSALVHFVAGERSKAAAQGHRLVHRSDHSIDRRLTLGGEGFGGVRRHQRYRPPAFGDDHLLAGFYGRENLGKALIGLARGDASHCMLQVVRVVHLARWLCCQPGVTVPSRMAAGDRTAGGAKRRGISSLTGVRSSPITRGNNAVHSDFGRCPIARRSRRMTATLDTAAGDPQQTIAELQRQLDECRTKLAARDSEFGEAIEHQSATIDVLKAMSASPGDPQPVFDLIVHRARDLCNTPNAGLFEFDGELVHRRSGVTAAYRTPEALEAYRRLFPIVPTRGSITCRAILDRQTIHVRDIASEPGISAAVRNLGSKSQIALPLLRDGAAIGAVVLGSGEVGGFTDAQVALLQTFAEQAVIAITSAETYRELQQRTGDLQESLEYQTATSEVLNVISRSTADVQPVLDAIVNTAVRLCGADNASILIRKGEVYRYVASSFSAAELEYWAILRQRTIVPGRNGIIGRVLLEGRVVQITDIRDIPDYPPEVVAAGRRTTLGVPLLREDEPIGLILLSRQRVEPYTERQIELVRTFADQAVIAIENARLLG